MLRLVSNLNKLGEQGQVGPTPPSPVPLGSEISPKSLTDVPLTQYEVYLFTCNTFTPILLTPQAYLSEEVRSTVYAMFCTTENGRFETLKRVHFMARVFGLSKVFQSTEGVSCFTIWGSIIDAPGQGGSIKETTSQHAEYWNARVIEDMMSQDYNFVPSCNQWNDMRNPSNDSQSQWSYDSSTSAIKYTVKTGPKAGTYTYASSRASGTGIRFGITWPSRITDALMVGPIEITTGAGDVYSRLAPLWSLVARFPKTGDLVWICLKKPTQTMEANVQLFEDQMGLIISNSSSNVESIALGLYQFTAAK